MSDTNDTSDTFRFIRVCGHGLLLPRLVLDTSNPIHRRRDERPDPPTRSYTPVNLNRAIRLTTPLFVVASVVGAGIVRVLFAGIARMGVVAVQGLS